MLTIISDYKLYYRFPLRFILPLFRCHVPANAPKSSNSRSIRTDVKQISSFPRQRTHNTRTASTTPSAVNACRSFLCPALFPANEPQMSALKNKQIFAVHASCARIMGLLSPRIAARNSSPKNSIAPIVPNIAAGR